MKAPATVIEATLELTIAHAICDGFWETAELPERWATTSHVKRAVFIACARRAISAGRAYREARRAAAQEARDAG
jgi:hypothetical protein